LRGRYFNVDISEMDSARDRLMADRHAAIGLCRST
jgi:hypothetical protein